LISLGLICRQHSHEAADVGIPDVALTIGCHTEWSRIFARESEQTEPSVLEAPEEAATHRTEPDRPIWCNGDSRYGRHAFGNRELFELAIGVSADLVAAKLEEPDNSFAVHSNIARRTPTRRNLVFSDFAGWRNAHQRVGTLQRSPGGAVAGYR